MCTQGCVFSVKWQWHLLKQTLEKLALTWWSQWLWSPLRKTTRNPGFRAYRCFVRLHVELGRLLLGSSLNLRTFGDREKRIDLGRSCDLVTGHKRYMTAQLRVSKDSFAWRKLTKDVISYNFYCPRQRIRPNPIKQRPHYFVIKNGLDINLTQKMAARKKF